MRRFDVLTFDCYGTLIDWEPKVELEQGLVKTIEYFKRKMGA